MKAETKEQDVWLRDDYRQARICVAMAAKGERRPFLESSYAVYGTHPDQVWPKVMRVRKAKLGREFSDWYDQAGNLKPDIPGKKPAIYFDEAAERASKERLAGVLTFRKGAPAYSATAAKQRTGKLYEMPSPALIEARRTLRILPVEDAG